MNKAFVREPEDTGTAFCPRCKSLGIGVSHETLASHLAPNAMRSLPETAFFCPFPTCAVAYFDTFDRVVEVTALLQPVYTKAPDAPLCAWFGVTRHDVEDDVREGVVTRVKELLAKAKSPA